MPFVIEVRFTRKHYVKGFYHEHKNHTDDCDSILDAYVCTEESDSQISSPDNKPLIFYLRQYEKRFRDFTEQLEFDLFDIECRRDIKANRRSGF